jgi:superfamily I DNA/RNA helicase
MDILESLNPQQREAVLATDGPILILAGAGTGKTRVITHRIAYLIQQGIPAGAILAVTFTNKAAGEMRERVRVLLEGAGLGLSDPWISTFHSFCVRLLRREAPRLGLPRDFAIYDDEEQLAALKLALRDLGSDDSGDTPREILSRISFAKNHGITPERALADAYDERSKLAARAYDAYEKTLRKNGALDFDDLLLRAVEVLRRFEEARRNWQQRFRYLHVDEYQDTNRVQYDLLRLLAGPQPNLCVVGDEDQSIYRWRGADVGNILSFAKDFPNARVFRVEQNYRSRQKILDAAAAVVSKNVKCIGKQLTATRGEGSNLVFYEARDARAEAEYVAQRVSEIQKDDSAVHCAVMYRTNAQFRSLEEAFRARGIRYRLLGGFSFYQRAEIRDIFAYVRLAMFADDDIALLRVLNTPPRGIGKVTVDLLRTQAREGNTSLWNALGQQIASGAARALAPLRSFRELTLHTAKGLEFDHVFLTGLEEGTFPHSRSVDDPEQIEEERRLCYVGMTRAKETLTLTRAVYRRIYGTERLHGSTPSRFLQEIPPELVNTAEGSLAAAGETRRYEPDPEYSYSAEEFARRVRRTPAPPRERGPHARPDTVSRTRIKRDSSNPLIGQRVHHPTYGAGTIIHVDGDDDDRKLTVSFVNHGTKKLVERYANLSWAQ